MWTTPEDIKSSWIADRQIPATDAQLSLFIKNVEAQIVNRYPNIQTWVDDETLSLDILTYTVSTIVVEYLLSGGEPVTNKSQSYTGAGSQSISYNASQSRYNLTLTEKDYNAFYPQKYRNLIGVQMLQVKPGGYVKKSFRRTF